MTSGEKIKRLRQRLNLSQLQFGNQIGVSDRSVSRWEKTNCIPFNKQLAIINKFDVGEEEVLDDDVLTSLNDNQTIINRIKSDYAKLDGESRKEVVALIFGFLND